MKEGTAERNIFDKKQKRKNIVSLCADPYELYSISSNKA